MDLIIGFPIPSKWITYAKSEGDYSLYANSIERNRNGENFLNIEPEDILRSGTSGSRILLDLFRKQENSLGKLIKQTLDEGSGSFSPDSLYQTVRRQLSDYNNTPLRFAMSDELKKRNHNLKKLEWEDLLWLATRFQNRLCLTLFDAALIGKCSEYTEEDMNLWRQLPYQCTRCWRRVALTERRSYLCQLHKKGSPEYLRMLRLQKKIEPFLENLEEEFSSLVDRVKYKSIEEVLDEEFPETKAYLEREGLTKFDLTQPLDLLAALNHPEEFILLNSLEMLSMFPPEAQVLQMLQRAEVFLSHLDSSGRIKGWGGKRTGAGRPKVLVRV